MNKLYLIVVISTLLFSSQVETKTGDFPKEEMISQKETVARMMAEAISKTLPQEVDKFTTLTAINSKDTTVTYTFEINTGSKSDEAVKKEDRSRMQEAVTMGVCKTSDKILHAGIEIVYLYLSANSKAKLFEFSISQKDCPIVIE